MNKEEFAKELGGSIGGTVSNNRWTCICGETNSDANPSLALYRHRQRDHVEYLDKSL